MEVQDSTCGLRKPGCTRERVGPKPFPRRRPVLARMPTTSAQVPLQYSSAREEVRERNLRHSSFVCHMMWPTSHVAEIQDMHTPLYRNIIPDTVHNHVCPSRVLYCATVAGRHERTAGYFYRLG